MSRFDSAAIAFELNTRARNHPIGKLQEIRTGLKRLSRQPGHDLFRIGGPSTTVFKDWAFHYGGRSEIQFNIGIEHQSGVPEFRHGIAFSFEPSRTLPDIGVLAKKVPLFSEFVQLWPERFADMRMWHFHGDRRSEKSMPAAIAPELVVKGIFVILGKAQTGEMIDYELVLEDMDRLLPLYRYVESAARSDPISLPSVVSFTFRPGCSTKEQSTKASHLDRELDVNLRHNLLQEALYHRLVGQFGVDNVGTELTSGVGTSVDVVVRQPTCFWFYEIKTTHSPRACIREAVGQLLEYCYWPGAQEAARLVVVGECPLDRDGEEYLRSLRVRFSLPIEYENIAI